MNDLMPALAGGRSFLLFAQKKMTKEKGTLRLDLTDVRLLCAR